MGWIIKQLTGAFGPYIIGAFAALLAVSAITAQVQTARLHHAKADLTDARAALKDPVTHKTWQSEAQVAQRDLTTCRGNETAMQGAIDGQNASIEALKQEAIAASKANRGRQEAAQAASRKDAASAARIMDKRPSGDLCASALSLIREP